MKRLTESAYGQMRTPPPSRNKSKNPSHESLYKRLAAIEDILGDEYDLDLVQKLIQAHKEGRYIIMKDPEQAGVSRLRELAQADREGVEKVWSPCNFCAGAKYITGGVTAVYPLSETRQQETLAEGDFDFCPVCGRPLTDEAVQMVLERMEALKDGKGD